MPNPCNDHPDVCMCPSCDPYESMYSEEQMRQQIEDATREFFSVYKRNPRNFDELWQFILLDVFIEDRH